MRLFGKPEKVKRSTLTQEYEMGGIKMVEIEKFIQSLKVVIITNLGQRRKSAENAENTTDFPETLQVPSLCCFHNLEPQNAWLVDVKRDGFTLKKIKGNFVRKNLKNKHRY